MSNMKRLAEIDGFTGKGVRVYLGMKDVLNLKRLWGTPAWVLLLVWYAKGGVLKCEIGRAHV
jgi:hypothetical protein